MSMGKRRGQWGLFRFSVLFTVAAIFVDTGGMAAEELAGKSPLGWPVVTLEGAWMRLDSPQRSIRLAARKEIEAQPFATWYRKALGETRDWAALEALYAVMEACPPEQAEEIRSHVCEGLTTLRIESMTTEQRRAAVHLTFFTATRHGRLSEDERAQMIDLWRQFLPVEPQREEPLTPFTEELRTILLFLERTKTASP